MRFIKWTASKNARLVDKQEILEKVYPFIREKITNLFQNPK